MQLNLPQTVAKFIPTKLSVILASGKSACNCVFNEALHLLFNENMPRYKKNIYIVFGLELRA